jgi:hypothetical protein
MRVTVRDTDLAAHVARPVDVYDVLAYARALDEQLTAAGLPVEHAVSWKDPGYRAPKAEFELGHEGDAWSAAERALRAFERLELAVAREPGWERAAATLRRRGPTSYHLYAYDRDPASRGARTLCDEEYVEILAFDDQAAIGYAEEELPALSGCVRPEDGLGVGDKIWGLLLGDAGRPLVKLEYRLTEDDIEPDEDEFD